MDIARLFNRLPKIRGIAPHATTLIEPVASPHGAVMQRYAPEDGTPAVGDMTT